ncbi:MAG: alkene reductase [Candidatus Sericytochromatia bacterium]|nr:alkene reductase [Candidatus Sericytochromatia bacterium]
MTTHAKLSLFSPYALGPTPLTNRLVMAPMTRSRATSDHVPTEAMARYYALRADAGLIITEGTAPAPEGLGYARIPGLFDDAHVVAWRAVTDAVHARGGKIFVQLMHCGRVAHPLNLPAGARVLAPSAVAAPGQMWTDQAMMQDHPVPEAMTEADIEAAVEAFVHAARCALAAGFDGVELHSANGYLLDQFLNPASNQRTDGWGGSAAGRNRFTLEVATRVAAAVGGERIGIRLSPFGVFNGMAIHDELPAQFTALAEALGALKLAYVHVVDHASMGAPEVPASTKAAIRKAFGGPVILSGGYDAGRAEADLEAGLGELVAFGRPFIANPDLVARLRDGKALAEPNPDTFYTPGEAGYLDYPTA